MLRTAPTGECAGLPLACSPRSTSHDEIFAVLNHERAVLLTLPEASRGVHDKFADEALTRTELIFL